MKQGRHSPKEGKDREPIKLFPYLSLLVLCCCQAPVQCSKPSANSIRQDGAIVSNHFKTTGWPAASPSMKNAIRFKAHFVGQPSRLLRSPFSGDLTVLGGQLVLTVSSLFVALATQNVEQMSAAMSCLRSVACCFRSAAVIAARAPWRLSAAVAHVAGRIAQPLALLAAPR